MLRALKRRKSREAYGLFSKQEAAQLIFDGAQHVHSSHLGAHDALAQLTRTVGVKGGEFCFPWERGERAAVVTIEAAEERHRVLRQVLQSMGEDAHRSVLDAVNVVLEELVSNAIYHSFRLESGERKYPRREKPTLQPSECIKVGYLVADEGIYLRVEDAGGSLSFDDVRESFHRCYQKGQNQILEKEHGAGLGLYMAFDRAMHLRVDVWPKKKTVVSCWINRRKNPDQDNFSFNYFERT